MTTQLLQNPQTVLDRSTGTGEVAHIVDQRATAGQDVTTAYIEGSPLIALCGHTWVPSKSPTNKPVCSKCIEEHKRLDGKPYVS